MNQIEQTAEGEEQDDSAEMDLPSTPKAIGVSSLYGVICTGVSALLIQAGAAYGAPTPGAELLLTPKQVLPTMVDIMSSYSPTEVTDPATILTFGGVYAALVALVFFGIAVLLAILAYIRPILVGIVYLVILWRVDGEEFEESDTE